MNIQEEISKKSSEIDEIIKKFLPDETGYQKTVLEAMNYSILAGGKRLRPMLMRETWRLFGGEASGELEPFMAAIEMIHTYSLIHDDLPAMDDDEFRRGRKTTHVVYGEAVGILAGDGLLNYAYETAVKSLDHPGNIEKKVKAFRILVEKPGIYGMLGGQAVDVENSDGPMENEKLDFIYRLKTGALIEASMMIGAVLAGAKSPDIDKTEQAASRIGLAFQIRDDILDVTGDMDITGKSSRSDEKNHKTTYVTLKGMECAKRDVLLYSREALELLDSLPGKNEFLRTLVQELICREK